MFGKGLRRLADFLFRVFFLVAILGHLSALPGTAVAGSWVSAAAFNAFYPVSGHDDHRDYHPDHQTYHREYESGHIYSPCL
jgi:hypothetical protein